MTQQAPDSSDPDGEHGADDAGSNESRLPESLDKLLAAYQAAADAGALPDSTLRGDDVPTTNLRNLIVGAIQSAGQPASLSSNTVLDDRYELLEAIGRGGTGQVWRALDRKFEREVAVKVLTSLASAALDIDRLVEREGRLMAKLHHQGAVRVLESGRDGEHRYLVMDLIGGIGLDAAIDSLVASRSSRKAPLTGADLLKLCGPATNDSDGPVRANEPWHKTAVRLGIELLRTLEAAHQVDVVHRDLKPANIRLIGGGRAVLLDWGHGLCNDHVPGTLTAHLFGTAAYSAPEQWGAISEVGPQTDIYQAGVVLCELLTLQRCFPDDSTAETMRRVREGDFKRPRMIDASVPAALEACVLRAMEIEPARRYASAEAFRCDLERWLDGALPDAARALRKASSSLRGFVRRQRTPLALSLAVLIGAALMMLSSQWSVAIAKGEDGVLRVQLDKPAVMVAFRMQEQDGGVFCSPVRITLPGTDGAKVANGSAPLECELPAGASEVQLHDIGDAPTEGPSFVEAVFAQRTDADAVAMLARLADLLQQAGRVVERRHGVWLTREQLEAMKQSGRGGAAIDVPISTKPQAQRWQHGDLQGIMIPW